jgi:hypothetical protein
MAGLTDPDGHQVIMMQERRDPANVPDTASL